MSPAGGWPQLNAAIEAGADAVYFGLPQFSARAKVGFEHEELPDVMRTLHTRGARGYLTFNTLVFDSELRAAAQAVERIADAGVDAVIVQDVGVARMVREIAPDLEIHGSTQMSITSAEGVEFARRFGVSRVVLARELSIDDIRQIRAATDCELEIFVHGALCVSYSGQCFSSEAWGGRSANRGQCAQACRLPYELYVDGAHKPLRDARYLLSPGDLYTVPEIPRLLPLGISSFKIEGRYKDADYVALTTAAYRKAVDEAWAGLPLSHDDRERLQLEQVYSRGLGPWFLSGTNHQQVVHGRAPRHRGVRVGQVVQVGVSAVFIEPSPEHSLAPLKPGDGVVFDAADRRSPQEREEGGRVYQVHPRERGRLEVRFANGAIDFRRIRNGDWLWRSDDPDVDRAARPFKDTTTPLRRQPVNLHLRAHVGQPLQLTLALAKTPAVQVCVSGADPLAPAQRQAPNEAALREQLTRLGGTAYEADGVQIDLAGSPFVPASALNALRRAAVDELVQLQSLRSRGQGSGAKGKRSAVDVQTLSPIPSPLTPDLRPPSVHLLVRRPEQLDAALTLPEKPSSITLDYLELYGLRPAVERVRAAGITPRAASPRVLKPSEERVVNFLRTLDCELLVRSSGLLHSLTNGATLPLITGDFSLNAANALSARAYFEAGFTRLTPAYDLNAAQLSELTALAPGRFEVVAYMHLPVFHTEHCVFCRFLSTGTSYKDCGHPCEKHAVTLRDEKGRQHAVLADVGCRNTVFGAEAQEISAHLDAVLRAGVRHFRLEFVHETADQVRAVTQAFQDALAGRCSATVLGARLAAVAPGGATQGSFFIPA